MRVKLREIYNTRYFYKTFVVDLNHLFNSICNLRANPGYPVHPINDLQKEVFDAAKAGRKIEFDLASCKITPDCIRAIMIGMRNGIVFCDTEDKCRDAILFDDMNRINVKTDSFVEMPKYNIGESVKEYIMALDKNVTYKIPVNDRELYFPIAYMIQCCRPSINIAPCGLEIDYMKFIGSQLAPSDLEGHDKFYYVTREGVRVINIDSNRKLYDQMLGYVSIAEALDVGLLIPMDFGNVKTLNLPCFAAIFDRCLNSIQAQGTKQKITLEQFFE